MSGGDDVRETVYDDGTRVVTTWHDDGREPSVVVTHPPGSKEANRRTITTKAQTALSANATFLAMSSPTAAQIRTQVNRLTREVNALIRLQLGDLDTTQDT